MCDEVAERLAPIAEVVDLRAMAGSSAVVVCTTGDIEAVAAEIALRAPAAVVAVACDPDADACAALYRRTLFPASRIVGCAPAAEGMAEAACRVATAAVLGTTSELVCTFGRDGRFESACVVVGPRGVERVVGGHAG